MKELRDDILIKEMNMVSPDAMLEGKGVIVISSEEDETECNEGKLLKEMQIVDGCILKVDDFFQNYELTITIIHKTAERDGPRFEIVADKDILKTAESVDELKKQKTTELQPQPSTSSGTSTNGKKNEYESDEDDLIFVESQPSAEKRKIMDDDEEESPSSKRARIEDKSEPMQQSSSANDDDDDDLICIDDD